MNIIFWDIEQECSLGGEGICNIACTGLRRKDELRSLYETCNDQKEVY
jgi:hypothetical protein